MSCWQFILKYTQANTRGIVALKYWLVNVIKEWNDEIWNMDNGDICKHSI